MELMRDPDTIMFMDFLDCFNLQNHVNFSTQIQHHHLDMVISDVLDSIVSSFNPGHLFSDHQFIHIKLHTNKLVPLNTEISYRKIKSIDHQDIKESFKSELCAIQQIDNLHQAVNTYNCKMGKILDAHAPWRQRSWNQSIDNHSSQITSELKFHWEDVRRPCGWGTPSEHNLLAF